MSVWGLRRRRLVLRNCPHGCLADVQFQGREAPGWLSLESPRAPCSENADSEVGAPAPGWLCAPGSGCRTLPVCYMHSLWVWAEADCRWPSCFIRRVTYLPWEACVFSTEQPRGHLPEPSLSPGDSKGLPRGAMWFPALSSQHHRFYNKKVVTSAPRIESHC